MKTADEIICHLVAEKRKAGYTTGPYWDYSRTVPQHLMEVWYKEARLHKLACTFEDFAWLMENETTSLYHKYYSYRSRWDRRRPLNENDREPYKRKNYGSKKVLSEDQIRKREWKKKKKNRKDQGSTLDYRGGWTCLQKESNRSERRKVNTTLQSGNWEAYGKTQWLGEDQMTPEFPENDWDNYVNPLKREHLNPWDYY